MNDPENSIAAHLLLQRLQISQVRNLNHIDLQLASGINVFHGANGAGKTSILEAIYILAQGKTFRHGRSENWIQHGCDQASVIIEYSQHNGAAETVCKAETTPATKRLGLIRGRQHWQARHDGEELQSYAQLSALLPVVLFQPYSHQLVEAGPEYRRQFLDWGVFHVEPEYLVSWRRYQKALKQRNASLKAHSSDAVIAAIDPVLAQAAQQLHAQRQHFFLQFQPHYQHMQQLLGGDFEPIDLAYEPGFPHPDTLQQDWLETLNKDRQRGFTLLGPHRADISLRTSRRGARGWLSRGQQKMVALAMLLAKLQLWQQDVGKGAVLLLDDVQSELDGYHLQQLLQLLVQQQQQVLITGTSASLGETIAAKRFHVEQGQIKAQ